MTITYHRDLIQGSEEWLAARCGLITASEMKLIVTPGTLKAACNEKERAHLYELAAQRLTRHVEPAYVSDDMLRGQEDEIVARALYAQHYAPVEEAGFVTNNRFGFTLGYSPDGLVDQDGQIECKSRRQKFQVQTVVENVGVGSIPADFLLQVQAGLIVTERAWCDFISYSGGLPLVVVRAFADEVVQEAIVEAAGAFEKRLSVAMAKFRAATSPPFRLIPTERRVQEEIVL